MSIKKNIPNTITLGNLFCGCLAIVKAFQGDLVWASYLVGIAAICDFFDGFAARLLKVSSPIGKDLDSLADMVTFGVVPSVILYSLISFTLPAGESVSYLPDMTNDIGGKPNFELYEKQYRFLPYAAFIVSVFSAIRLARFNNDTRQAESFIGLPTPANAILICSLPLLLQFYFPFKNEVPEGYSFEGIVIFYLNSSPDNELPYLDLNIFQRICAGLLNPWLLAFVSVISAFLLVVPLPLFALKFRHFKWKGNEIRFIFLAWSVLLLVFLQFLGIPLIILSYMLFSVINNLLVRTRTS